MKVNIPQLEKKIGYSFKNKDLLITALTHSSFAYEISKKNATDNEVLEFLGDSVLGLVIAAYLCSTFPDLTEGELSKLKSSAESTGGLSRLARKINLDKYILLGKGEENSGGRKKRTILAGAFEALVAAIYLDGGLEKANTFLMQYLKSFFKKINADSFLVDNYKSALQEHFQQKNLPAPVYKILTEKGPDHKKRFIVEVLQGEKSLAKAVGNSKKNAEQRAAQKALKNIMGKKIKVFSLNTFLRERKK